MIRPLTSLRFIFALMVFVYHFCYINIHDSTLHALYSHIFSEGYIGVSFFFILSGFVLALNYKDKLTDGRITTREFFIARFARIYPMYFFALLFAIPTFYFAFKTDAIASFGKLVAHIFLVQSFIPSIDVYYSINPPSWSISTEMFFYLMFPLIIAVFYKYRNAYKVALTFLMVIPIAIFLCPQELEYDMFYVNPLFRISDFMLGIFLYNLYERMQGRSTVRSVISSTVLELLSIMLFVIFMAFHKQVQFGYRFSCYYWLPMVLIIFVFSQQAGLISKLLSKRIFVLMGEISYSFYLLHYAVIKYVLMLNGKIGLIGNDFVLVSVIFVITLIGSYLTYQLIELPANQLIKLRYKKVLVPKDGKEI
jgi:peptidoglycan/LPS O-acetylase OafA/YrhL